MLTLYHAPMTRSARIVWLLEELGLPYEVKPVAFTPPAVPFSQPTPSGKVPVLIDGDLTMAESGAILEYVVERYGKGRLAPRWERRSAARTSSGYTSPKEPRRRRSAT